jgi:GT2 family glycosyltransferase
MISIVICSIDDAKFGAVAQMYDRLLAPGPIEVIRVADARSLADGYNRGIKASRGEHLILCHDDIEILTEDLSARLTEHLGRFDLIGVAGTTLLGNGTWVSAGPPYIYGQVAHPTDGGFMLDIYSASRRVVSGIQAIDGVWMAMRRSVCEKVSFDEVNFDGFHMYDMDFAFRAHLAGLKLAVCCDIRMLHQSTGKFDAKWERYAARFMQKHAHKLAPLPPKEFMWEWVKVSSKEGLRQAMTPISWEE